MAEGNETHHKPQPKPEGEGNRREVIGTALFELLWFSVDIFFVAPESHIWALLLGSIGIAIALYRHIPSVGLAFKLIGVLILATIAIWPFLPPTETEQHGWLTPANDALMTDRIQGPYGWCGEPRNALLIFFGGNVAYMDDDVVHLELVRMGDAVLGAERTAKGLSVNARLFSEEGLIVEIEANEFRINPNRAFAIERPDSHTLIVRDNWGKTTLKLRYLNQRAIEFSGRFFYPGHTPLIFDDVHGPSSNGNCFGRVRSGQVIVSGTSGTAPSKGSLHGQH